MINFDFWYGESKKDIAKITCYFNDCDCYYWGHLYNKDNNIIGDYNTTDFVELEKEFQGIFGN